MYEAHHLLIFCEQINIAYTSMVVQCSIHIWCILMTSVNLWYCIFAIINLQFFIIWDNSMFHFIFYFFHNLQHGHITLINWKYQIVWFSCIDWDKWLHLFLNKIDWKSNGLLIWQFFECDILVCHKVICWW